jgi:uncharacterized membrane protein
MPGKVNQTVFLIYMATALGIVAWLGAIFWAPYLRSHASAWQGPVYAIFSPVCHQIPSRSFHILGQPLAVCARCLGIYAGFLGGVAAYPFFRAFSGVFLPQTRIFILLSFPIGLDTLANLIGLWGTSNEVRFATGLVWGVILPFYFITGLADLALRRKEKGDFPGDMPLEK